MSLDFEGASGVTATSSSSDDPVERSADVPATSETPLKPKFGAGKAILAFFILLGTQFLAGIAVMIAAMIVAVLRGESLTDPSVPNRIASAAAPALLIVSGVASVLAVLMITRLWAWQLVRDTSDAGIGVTRPRRRHLLVASAAGIVLGVSYVSVVAWIVPYEAGAPLGPLAAAATGGPLNRGAFAVLALLFAPIVEEFFFRGLLLKGFSTTWGLRTAGVLVTALFVLLHLTETFRYWPATIAVTMMALGALVARTSTGSLGPAVALHAAYNLVILWVVMAAPFTA